MVFSVDTLYQWPFSYSFVVCFVSTVSAPWNYWLTLFFKNNSYYPHYMLYYILKHSYLLTWRIRGSNWTKSSNYFLWNSNLRKLSFGVGLMPRPSFKLLSFKFLTIWLQIIKHYIRWCLQLTFPDILVTHKLLNWFKVVTCCVLFRIRMWANKVKKVDGFGPSAKIYFQCPLCIYFGTVNSAA